MIANVQSMLHSVLHRGDLRRTCRRCHNRNFERSPRLTFVQHHVMPFFDLYPWRCTSCGQTIFRTLRTNAEDPAHEADGRQA